MHGFNCLLDSKRLRSFNETPVDWAGFWNKKKKKKGNGITQDKCIPHFRKHGDSGLDSVCPTVHITKNSLVNSVFSVCFFFKTVNDLINLSTCDWRARSLESRHTATFSSVFCTNTVFSEMWWTQQIHYKNMASAHLQTKRQTKIYVYHSTLTLSGEYDGKGLCKVPIQSFLMNTLDEYKLVTF